MCIRFFLLMVSCVAMMNCAFCFFFSSRRRHTRCLSDWSSDVCSSDLGNVVPRSVEIRGVARRFVVDGAVVNYPSLRINDEHVRCCLGVIKMTDLALGIEERGCRSCMHLLHIVVFLIRGYVALCARSRRDHGKPDDSLAGPFLPQTLHVAALIVLLGLRTSVVVPLQHH